MAIGAAGKKTIALVVAPHSSRLEMVGTYSMLVSLTLTGRHRLVIVGERRGLMSSDTPLMIACDQTYAETPRPEGHFVIGGPAALADGQLLDYVRAAGATAEFGGGVSGSALALAATDLLRDQPATTHWVYRADLERLGARYMRRPWVEAGKFITGAGVSGGLEMGLRLVEQRVNGAAARRLQVLAEYEPQPPFGRIDWSAVERQPECAEPAAGAEVKDLALVLYPGLTPLDLVGPLQILAALACYAPQFRPVVVSESVEPIPTDNGLVLLPNKTFAEGPHPYALIVPGGGTPTLRALNNVVLRRYVRAAAETAAVVASGLHRVVDPGRRGPAGGPAGGHPLGLCQGPGKPGLALPACALGRAWQDHPIGGCVRRHRYGFVSRQRPATAPAPLPVPPGCRCAHFWR
ncbi:MAG: DJ-1/PfpI family protein [Anaerolineales bacterium]|nr:DJ-1/PfpI family protein [Anaerolineales bacterium]